MIRYITIAVIALTVGALVGMAIAELSRRQSVVAADAPQHTTDVELKLSTQIGTLEAAIIERDARIKELEEELAVGIVDSPITHAKSIQSQDIIEVVEKTLKLSEDTFRGVHPVAGSQFTVTQVRKTRHDTDYGELLIELRNDSGEHQELVPFSMDMLDRKGNLLENSAINIMNWPSGTLRTGKTVIDHPDDLYEIRVSSF